MSNFLKIEFNPDYDYYYTDKEFIVRVKYLGNRIKLSGKKEENWKRIDSILYFIEIDIGRKDT